MMAAITYPFEFAKTRSQLNRNLPDSMKQALPPFPSREWYTGCTSLMVGNAVKAAVRESHFYCILTLLFTSKY